MPQSFTVQVQPDHLEKLTRARPVPALAELIWNALDADATKVEVEIERNELGMTAVIVRDNGDGIPHADAEPLFKGLGGSWKRHARGSKTKGRMLHGQEGKGRFKAFALGRVVDWQSTYRDAEGTLRRYTIGVIAPNLRDGRIGDEEVIEDGGTGLTVRISELHHDWPVFESEAARQELTETFALYLTDYPDATIAHLGLKLDPTSVIADRKRFPQPAIDAEGKTYPAVLDLIEWRTVSQKALYLCDANGFPLTRAQNKFHTGDFQFSAYLRSPYITLLHDEGRLDLGDMDVALVGACEAAVEAVKAHFKSRAAEEAQHILDAWKKEDLYPYQGTPVSQVEVAERKVFDIVAVNVSKSIPDFAASAPKAKKFQLRMLRQVIEDSPDDLQTILTEVLNLSPRKQEELAKLLRETSLTAIITASKMVADRLKFITALDAILFDPDTKKRLKERSQLHRILAHNTWVFGEEFNLTADDEGLTQVLRQHAKLAKLDVKIDEPVKRIDNKRGIIDLMLSRTIKRNRADELEHLVVELKAPKVKIGSDELVQTEKYAMSVARDERFRGLRTRWTFWVVSNDMDEYAEEKANQANLPPGVTHQSKDRMVTVYAKTWSQIIEENKLRLDFFKEKLEHTADRGTSLKYLQETYEAYLKGVLQEEEGAEEDAERPAGVPADLP